MAQVVEVTDTAPTNGAVDDGDGAGTGAGRRAGVTNVAVTWGLRRANAFPPKRTGGGGFRRNVELESALEQIDSNPDFHNQTFVLGVYADDERANNSARTKASALRKRYTEEDGWEFRVGPDEEDPNRIALYVKKNA